MMLPLATLENYDDYDLLFSFFKELSSRLKCPAVECEVGLNQPHLNAAEDSRLLTRTDTQQPAAVSAHSNYTHSASVIPHQPNRHGGSRFGDGSAVGGLTGGCNRSSGDSWHRTRQTNRP